MLYGWRQLTLDLPEELEDHSTLTFVERRGERVIVSLTVTRERMEHGLDAYVADAVDAMRRSLGGYQVVRRASRPVAGLDARVLEQTAVGHDGLPLRQLQAYVADGAEVVIVTATALDDARDRLATTFNRVLDGLRVQAASPGRAGGP